MNLEQRVDDLDRDMRALRAEVAEVRVDLASIKGTIPFLATKQEVTHSRNVIIYWLIGLYLATGLYSHFPITITHNSGDRQLVISQPARSLGK